MKYHYIQLLLHLHKTSNVVLMLIPIAFIYRNYHLQQLPVQCVDKGQEMKFSR